MKKSLKSRLTCILRSKLELKLKIVWRARAADYSFTYTFQTRGAARRGVALKAAAAGRNDKSRHDQTSSMERSKNKIRNGKNKTMYRRKLAITAVAASAAAAAAKAVKSSAPVNYVIMPGNLHLAARHYILHAFCLPTGIQLDIPNMAAQWTV